MRKILEKCPSCGGDLEVTRLNCTNCDTVITGHYQPCRFCKLSPDHQDFLEAFVKSRGNVKEMERELGISYWTIRSRLNDVIKALGFEVEAPQEDEGDVKHRRKEILEQLDRGEIEVGEATDRLAQLR
jgi:hypothetical protein